MKVKLMSLLAGLVTLTLVTAPLAAQACNGSNKDKNTQESNLPESTENSVTVEETSFSS